MAIRKSSSSGTPFGSSENRPTSPLVGQTYYNGTLGYLEIYTVSGWIPATGANDFSLNLSGTNTTITFEQSYSSGSYSIVSFGNDLSLDVYAYAADGSFAGYSNTKSFTASQRFNKMVVLGGVSGDVLSFSYKTTYATSASTSDITAGPYITSISPSGMPNANSTITVTGGNFASNVTASFTGTGYSSTAAKSIVRTSSTSLVVTRPDNFPSTAAPYTLTITNPSVANQPTGSAVHQFSGITAGSVPVWQTASSISIPANTDYSLSLSATDADGSSSISYAYVSGTLPTGIAFNSSTGVISGNTSVPAGTYTYTVSATDSGNNTSNLTISFYVAYAVLTGGTLFSDSTHYYRLFTANANLVISANSLTTEIFVLGGGGGANGNQNACGGGGGGGFRTLTNSLMTAGTYPVVVGSGGAGTTATNGNSSSINNFVSSGGGKSGTSGGSGGGGNRDGGGTPGSGNAGGYTPVEGYSGGATAPGPYAGAGGGGGAGAAGSGGGGGSQTGEFGGVGGVGRFTTLTNAMAAATSTGQLSGGNYYYGGGGGGGTEYGARSGRAAGGLGGGGFGSQGNATAATSGTANTGGGGGGSGTESGTSGGGGSGLVIVRYTKTSVGE